MQLDMLWIESRGVNQGHCRSISSQVKPLLLFGKPWNGLMQGLTLDDCLSPNTFNRKLINLIVASAEITLVLETFQCCNQAEKEFLSQENRGADRLNHPIPANYIGGCEAHASGSPFKSLPADWSWKGLKDSCPLLQEEVNKSGLIKKKNPIIARGCGWV